MSIKLCHLRTHESEINGFSDTAQRVVLADALFEIDAIIEQLGLRLVDAHHKCWFSDVPTRLAFKNILRKCDLGNRPLTGPPNSNELLAKGTLRLRGRSGEKGLEGDTLHVLVMLPRKRNGPFA